MNSDYNQISKSKYGFIIYNKYDEWVGKSLEVYVVYLPLAKQGRTLYSQDDEINHC